MTIRRIARSVTEKNDLIASRNRSLLDGLGILGVNLMSSPGSGKTTLLEALAVRLGGSMAVIEGDVSTRRDAERILSRGVKAWQIETGGACHLDASSVAAAVPELRLSKGVERFLVIENVGNLICPSSYDLGERLRVGLLSLPEGDDKVMKYPSLFSRIDLLLLTKKDLAPHMGFDAARAARECRTINPGVRTIELSALTGEGMEELVGFLEERYTSLPGS